MTKREHAAQLRADTSIHYNCCQAVLVPFAAECGLDEESALRLGQHFGSGMRMGAICGTVTGGLMVLGLAGAGEEKAKQFRRLFQEGHGDLNCASLLQRARERGMERKCHCDGMVFEAVECLERLLSE